jgi:hypothetical protein
MDDANRTDNQAAYDTARSDRQGGIRALITLLQKALGLSNPKSDYARTIRERLSKLGGAKAVKGTPPAPGADATFGGDLGDPALSDTEQEALKPEKDTETEADRIKQTGMTDAERGRLADIERDIALAGLTADLGDDRSAAGQKVGFLETILAEALAEPGRGGSTVIAQIADDLKSARDDATALNGGGGTVENPDLQAQLDQQRERTRVAERERDIANQAVGVFGGPGDIGTGGSNAFAAARSPIIIQTLHPGDPATLRAVGDAATKGQALQPARTSPRSRSGI